MSRAKGVVLAAAAAVLLSEGGPASAGIKVADPDSEERTKWALIVAVDRYADERMPARSGAEAASAEIAQQLVSRYGYDAENVIELYGEAATGRNVNNRLRMLAERTGFEDSLFVMISLTSVELTEREGSISLIPHDGDVEDPWSMIRVPELVAAITDLPVNDALAVFDACASSWDPGFRITRGMEYKQQVQQQPWRSDLREFGAAEFVTTCSRRPVMLAGPVLDWLAESVSPGKRRSASDLRIALAKSVEAIVELTTYGSVSRFRFIVTGLRNEDLDIAMDRNLSDGERVEAIERLVRAQTSGKRDPGAMDVGVVTDALVDLSKDRRESLDLRQRAVLALGQLGAESAAGELAALASGDEPSQLRLTAVRALEQLPFDAAVLALEEVVSAGDPVATTSAVRSLVSLNAVDAVPFLVALFPTTKDTALLLTYLDAVRVLGGGDVSLVEPLIRLASRDDVHPDVVASVVSALASMPSPSGQSFVLELLSASDNSDIRRTSAYALGPLTGDANVAATLIAALQDADDSVREAAAYSLRRPGLDQAVAPLVGLLDDRVPGVRVAAARSLGVIGSSDAIPAVRRLFSDEVPAVRVAAALAVADLGATESFSELITMSELDDSALAQRAARSSLSRLLESTNFEGADATAATAEAPPAVRVAALSWLKSTRDPAWTEIFRQGLESEDPRVRSVASSGLALFGTDRALASLRAELKSEQTDRRQRAIVSLGIAKSDAALDALLELEPRPEEHGLYLEALGEYTHEAALRHVKEFASHDNPRVRLAAADALARQAAALAGKDDLPVAIELAESSLDVRQELLGWDHPDVVASLNDLGVMHRRAGDLERSEGYLRRALSVREKYYGPSDPVVATTLANLAEVYVERGANERALEAFLRALEIQEFSLGRNSKELLPILERIVFVYEALGADGDAERFSARAREIARRAEQAEAANAPPPPANLRVIK